MVDANMFDMTSVGGEEYRHLDHDKQTFGEMVADAAQSLAAGFDLTSKNQSYPNLPHQLQTSIFTRDNANLFEQTDHTNVNNSHSEISSMDAAPHQQGGTFTSSAQEGQAWSTATDQMSNTPSEWSMADHHSLSASMPSIQQHDMSLNYMHNTPSMLFNGSSAASAFMNDSTPSSTEPIWQRRMHARNQSQQTQEYDNALLAMLADSQSSMALHAAHYSAIYSGADVSKAASMAYPSFAQESSWNISNTMSPNQMQWNGGSSTSYSLQGGQHLQRNSSGSHSSGNISSQTPESSLLNQQFSSFPTSLSASPVDPGSAKLASAPHWGSPSLDQSEESEDEQTKKGSRKIRKREDGGGQMKARRQSKTAVSPRSVPVSLSKPDSARSSNEDFSEAARDARKNSNGSNSSSSSSIPKGVINKVVVSKGSGMDGSVIQTETGEGGETRHLCPQPGCDKHFSTSGHARRHSRIHASLRPFECPHQGCGATFTRRDNCTQHQRARHRCQLTAKRISDDAPLPIQETA